GAGSVTRPARANGGALAEELPRSGPGLTRAEPLDQAWPTSCASPRREPSTGTRLNRGVCHAKQGKLGSAWNEFQAALAAARRDGREGRMRFAEEHIKAIEPNLSRLTITLPKESDVEGLEVQLDGTKVGRPALGVALPVDPGTHEITVSAPGKNPWKSSIEIPEGPGQQSVSIPVLSDASVESTAEANAAQPQDTGKKSGNTQRFVAYGTAGLGLVGLGLGAGFGLDALGKNSSSNKNGC